MLYQVISPVDGEPLFFRDQRTAFKAASELGQGWFLEMDSDDIFAAQAVHVWVVQGDMLLRKNMDEMECTCKSCMSLNS